MRGQHAGSSRLIARVRSKLKNGGVKWFAIFAACFCLIAATTAVPTNSGAASEQSINSEQRIHPGDEPIVLAQRGRCKALAKQTNAGRFGTIAANRAFVQVHDTGREPRPPHTAKPPKGTGAALGDEKS